LCALILVPSLATVLQPTSPAFLRKRTNSLNTAFKAEGFIFLKSAIFVI
jgi:hypothetical protein